MSLVNFLGVAFHYSASDGLFENVTFSVDPGDRIAIVGPNGRDDVDSRCVRRSKHGQCVTASLRLMGKKLLVSLAMEGKFSGEGLQTLDDGDELVTERGIGEPAEVVWRQLQMRRDEMSRRELRSIREDSRHVARLALPGTC